MTVPNEETQEAVEQVVDENTGTDGNPNWQAIFEIVPTEFHEMLKPKLKEWDDGVQSQFGKIHEKYDPYKDVIESGMNPQEAAGAIQFAKLLDDDPQKAIEVAIKHFDVDLTEIMPDATNKGDIPDDEDDDIAALIQASGLDKDDPLIKKILEQQNTITSRMDDWESSAEAEEAEKALDTLMADLHKEYDEKGGFDDVYVLAALSQGIEAEEAVKMYQSNISQFVTTQGYVKTAATPNSDAAPNISGNAGTVGSGTPDTRQVPKGIAETNKVVEEILRVANEA